MFADPPESGFFGKWFFHDRCTIDKYAIADRSDSRLNPIRQFLQAFAQYFVIIPAECISGDVGTVPFLEYCRWRLFFIRKKVHPGGNNADRIRYECPRSAAPIAMPGHIIHFAVIFGFQPFLETTFRLSELDIRDSELLKSEFDTPRFNLACNFFWAGNQGQYPRLIGSCCDGQYNQPEDL